ncbi:OLC1v1000770C1 [Oldenlandia corymbosa var. corymbosa]|uniref:OLC1v1000770C1 n=1 Tax=Oldenlandia corymbosa var. corymbosa TaxID=529605 RepID=A0AAV1D3R6_OLDCO|nr:OLC1v1000770C1 [Oldenlandia corymbosa var. corymbosa]
MQLFVPVLANDHYYLYVFNMLDGRVEVLDNMDTAIKHNIPFVAKYGETYNFLVEPFARYANSQRAIVAYARLRKLKEPKIIDLPWSNSENKTDCAVYMMCHMKTYKAGVDGYNCGIPPIGRTTRQKDAHQNKLDKLRIKYLT